MRCEAAAAFGIEVVVVVLLFMAFVGGVVVVVIVVGIALVHGIFWVPLRGEQIVPVKLEL